MRVRCDLGAGRSKSKDFSTAYKSDGCTEFGVGGVRGAGIFLFNRVKRAHAREKIPVS